MLKNNLEKIGVYLASLVFVTTTWFSVFQIHDKIDELRKEIDVRERIAKLEVKVEKLEEKK